MSRGTTLTWLIAINILLAVGDFIAKKAVATPERSTPLTAFAMGIWVIACCMWLPVMRSRGFTKLIALADVIGLLMLAIVGYLFLNERLTAREGAGVGLSIVAVYLLG